MSIKSKTMLLSNLSFDHPLTLQEINDLITMLSQGVSIGQVYFKDAIDIASIEKVKLLLEALPNIDDKKIEKYIMKTLDNNDKNKLDEMNFQNIDTWNIAYSIEHNRFSVTTLSKYRLIDEWFKNTIKEMPEELSCLEKVCYLYDKVKLFEFSTEKKYGRLPEIISDGVANSYGYNLLFKELLTQCEIPCKMEPYMVDGEDCYITMVGINDEKHGVEGIYLFDSSMDTIGKEQYKNGLARRMNYNFCAITLDKFSRLNGRVVPGGILKILMGEDELGYKHNLNKHIKKYGNQEILEIEDIFQGKLRDFYLKCCNTNDINEEILFNIFSERVNCFSRNNEERELLQSTLISNYKDRESELFVSNSVKKMSKNTLLSA